MTRLLTSLMMVCTLALGSSGCTLFSGDPDSAFAAFAEAVHAKDPVAAADRTSDPGAAARAITAMFDGMGKSANVDVAVDDSEETTATLSYTWSFGPGRELRYQTQASAVKSSNHWRVQWSPTVLQRKLGPDISFQYSDDKNYLTPIVDRDGLPLLDWQTVGVVSLTRDHLDSAAALANVLQHFDTVTAESIQRQFDATTDNTVTVIRLRAQDLDTVTQQLAQIPGVAVTKQGALLTANPELSSPVIGSLEPLWQKAIDATAGWSVYLVDSKGAPVDKLTATPPAETPPIRTSMDTRLQLLAQQAVAIEQRPTVLVAISPATGGIVAAAQNEAANAKGPIAFTGVYPPGSTFKTITTAAALQAGLVTPDAAVACPGRITIENRTIPNDDEFDLGTVPLRSAFAQSCNTTMGALADRLPADALGNTARMFGIGVDYVIPGVTTVTGRVPDANTGAQRVENGIGQGTVTVSPFGLAVAEASLAHGSTITPNLILGEHTTADTEPVPIPPAVAKGLRSMMRETVTAGTATELRNIDGLGGKTGTAEFGDNTHSHGWFAGIVDDIAFATLVVGGDSSTPAVAVSGAFLRPALTGGP